MAGTNSEPSTAHSLNARSVIRCPQASNFTWDLSETTLPSILFPITSIASLAVIFLNALVVLAFQQKRELKKTSTILLSSIAIADLLVGAISMPLNVAAEILISRQVFYSGFCTLRIATDFSMFTFLWSSLYHLTFIAWERYVAIRKSIDYRIIVTEELVKKLPIVAWLFAAFASFPPLIMLVVGVDLKIKEIWHIGEAVLAASCLTAIGYFYIMVYLGVRKRKITEISHVSALVKAKQEIKVVKTTGLITAALILSFVPVFVVGGLGEVFPVLRTSNAFLVAETLIQLNSLANPLIYFYRDRRFRKAALELLRVRKPEAIQPAVRKRSAGFTGSCPGTTTSGATRPLQTSRFVRPPLASDCVDRGCHEIFSRRAFSVSNLDTNKSECFDALQGSQVSSIVITTAIIHTKSGLRHQAKSSTPDSFKLHDTSQFVQIIPRSKFTDTSAFVKCGSSCQMLQEVTV